MMTSILSLQFFRIHLDGMDTLIQSFHILLNHFRFVDADRMEQPELPNGELDNGSFFGAFSQKILNISLFIRGLIIIRGKFSFPQSRDFNE